MCLNLTLIAELTKHKKNFRRVNICGHDFCRTKTKLILYESGNLLALVILTTIELAFDKQIDTDLYQVFYAKYVFSGQDAFVAQDNVGLWHIQS